MSKERVPAPAKNNGNMAPPGKPEKASQAKYCGFCPACRALGSRSFRSPGEAAGFLQGHVSSFTAYRSCISSYLQANYSNNFAQIVLTGLYKPQDSAAGNKKEPVMNKVEDIKKGRFEPSQPVANYLSRQGKAGGAVNVNFGKLAAGNIKIEKKGNDYFTNPRHQIIDLDHPLLKGIEPALVLSINNSIIQGYISPNRNGKPPGPSGLLSQIKKAPEIMGLYGLDIPKLPKLENKLEDGSLRLGGEIDLALGGAFDGTASIMAEDEKVSFNARAKINVKGLAGGSLELKRSNEGLITGTGDIGLNLSDQYSGKIKLVWNGDALSGQGQVGYKDEKLQGTVTMKVMERKQAEAHENTGNPGKTPNNNGSQGGAKKARNHDYVVFGDGALTFAFNDWLTGSANVIVDHKGYVTLIGEITPQAELELFPQKDFVKELPEFEARAPYGIPVIGNVFLFVNIGLILWAKMGPGKLYNISVIGTYSTDPQKRNDFTIQGSLNISAGAGLTLRGEGGAGLEILDHDVKAGAGVNGQLGIKGYVDATPAIGYREGENKKGVFYLRGDMEIAAQPFLGLSGDLFIEVDSPWYSLLPDKRWSWPLGSKEWPLGGSFGIGASIDYILGSRQVPAVDFHKVDFSADKFMTDLLHDKTKPRSGSASSQKGKWKEKNTPSSKPPAQAGKMPSGVKEGKPRHQPARSQKPPGKFSRAPKTVKDRESQTKTRFAEQRKVEKEIQARNKKTGPQEKIDKRKKEQWNRGVQAVKQALQYAEKDGVSLEELNTVLKSIRRHKSYGFTKLEARQESRLWVVYGSMSPAREVTKVKKKEDIVYNAQLSIPGTKEHANEDPKHINIYQQKARNNKLFHKKRNRNTNQRSKWKTWAKANIMPEVKEKAKIIGMPEEDLFRPRFNREGKNTAFHIDHIVEYQLGGKDRAENYWLLRGSENSSSGAKIKKRINDARKKLNHASGKIYFKNPVLEGSPDKAAYWTRSEIKRGMHVDVYKRKRGNK